MHSRVHLLGLDFGTTTSCAVVASACMFRNSVTGRMELSDVRESFRSDLVFTPMAGDRLDLVSLEHYLDAWLDAARIRPEEIFGGGALLTGLTAQRDNAAGLIGVIKGRLQDALVATADDPCMESWLAFMGSCAPLSREHPERAVLNLDVGGGTTNLALGQAGEVLGTGCLFVGARHVQVAPGTYRIVRLSSYAQALFDHLKIARRLGDELADHEVDAIVGFHVALLRAALHGERQFLQTPIARLHQQVPWTTPAGHAAKVDVVTFSGGVGELIYNYLHNKTWPETTCFGDLGIDLAKRIVAADCWGADWRRFLPGSRGRATVYGLLRHSTQIAGSTVFLPDSGVLPLVDVPILGTIAARPADVGLHIDEDRLAALLDLARRSPRGACLQVSLLEPSAAGVRELAEAFRAALEKLAFPPSHPLVLLMEQNAGKVLGHSITRWGQSPRQLLVLDEIAPCDAHYVRIGAPRHQVIPVSLYGLRERGAPREPADPPLPDRSPAAPSG